MRASNPLCVGGQPMVALNEQFHHNGTPLRLRVTGYGVQRNGESGSSFIDQRSRITDQKCRTSNDLFNDHCSLVIERSAGANEIMYCGYPDNKRVSTDIGTGLNDPETGLCYIRSRTYNSIPGMVLRQEPKSRQATGVATRVLQRDPIGYAGGINLYEYVGAMPCTAPDPLGLVSKCKCGVKGVVHLISQGWTVNVATGTAHFNFEVRIDFENGHGYKPSCCRYIQWLQGRVSFNGVSVKRSGGGTPFDGKLHVDAWPYRGDNDTNPSGGVYQNSSGKTDEFLSHDVPGWNGGLKVGDNVNWNVTFEGTAIDTCNGNKVLGYATQSFTELIVGTFPKLKTAPR